MSETHEDDALRAIEQSEVIHLSMADQECIAHALLSPPKPAPALVRLLTEPGFFDSDSLPPFKAR